MEIMTVNQLLQACIELKTEGLGDRRILISNDDECNGTHYLFPYFTHKKEQLRSFQQMGMMPRNILEADLENYIVLG